MTVSEIKREDVFRLIEFMKKTDETLLEAHGRWNDCYTLESFISIKAAVLAWGRIAEILGFPRASCTCGLPVLSMDEFPDVGDDAGESIMEYIMSSFDLAEAKESNLLKAGITVVHDTLEPVDFMDYQDIVNEAMEEDGEVLDDAENFNRAVELYKDECCSEVSIDFPDFYRSMIKFACENEFYSSDVCFMKSRRIGRFEQARDQLKLKLPIELYEGILFLISAVFMPLYCFFPDLTTDGLNDKGEYCQIYALGSFLTSDEEVLDIHKRPYADIAVALLDRLMTEAEALAPEFLCELVDICDESLNIDAVKKAACAA